MPILTILERVAAGDRAAVRECIDQYGALVWSLARRWSRTPTDAEDATQEIFLAVWLHAARFDPTKGSDKTFIAVIARRRLIDRLRKVRHEPTMESMELLEFMPRSGWQEFDSETAVDVEQASRAFAQLRTDQREVLALALLNGLSHSEIAIRLGMPLGTVKSSMRRGLLQIRALLKLSAPNDRSTDV